MNCDYITGNIDAIAAGRLPRDQQRPLLQHLEDCAACNDAVSGADALVRLRERNVDRAPDGLYLRIRAGLEAATSGPPTRDRFWQGMALGGLVAASLFAVALVLRPGAPPETPPVPSANPVFSVALGASRTMNVAVETQRPLADAHITVMLSGGIELDGYVGERELSWTADLEAGVNRLALPVRAITREGGSLMVQLRHPASEQMFVVDVRPDI